MHVCPQSCFHRKSHTQETPTHTHLHLHLHLFDPICIHTYTYTHTYIYVIYTFKGCRPGRPPGACISILTQRCLKLICTCFPGPWPSGVRIPWALVRSGRSADQFWRLQGWKGTRTERPEEEEEEEQEQEQQQQQQQEQEARTRTRTARRTSLLYLSSAG